LLNRAILDASRDHLCVIQQRKSAMTLIDGARTRATRHAIKVVRASRNLSNKHYDRTKEPFVIKQITMGDGRSGACSSIVFRAQLFSFGVLLCTDNEHESS